MVYVTDGSPHANGIAGEHETIRFINEDSITIKAVLCPGDYLIHVGGTQTKVDARVNSRDVTVSIKKHKTGTFDWINTTRYSILDKVKKELNEFKRSVEAPESKDGADKYRKPIAKIYRTHLEQLASDDIQMILRNCYEEYPDFVIIKAEKKSEYILFETSSCTHPHMSRT